MKLLGIYIQNYGSWRGRHYVPLADRGLVMVLGENQDDPRARSNGAGKSTWVDALDWALWGEHPRGDAAHTVVTDGSTGGCVVTVQVLDDSGSLIQVSRLRDHPTRPNGPVLLVDGQDRTALDGKETQVLIGRLLGLDRTVFHAAVLFSQGQGWQFADATDGERKQLLTAILPELGEVDEAAERVALLAASAAQEAVRMQQAAAAAEASRAMLVSMDPTPRIAEWEQGRQGRVQAQLAEIAAAELIEVGLAVDLRAADARLAQVPPAPAPSQVPANLRAAREQLVQLGRAIQLQDRDIAERRGAAMALKGRIDQLANPRATTCGACGQPLGPDARQHVAAELAGARQAYDQAVAGGKTAVASLDSQRAELDRVSADVMNMDAAWQASQVEVERLRGESRALHQAREATARHLQAAQANTQRWREALARERAALNPVEQERDLWLTLVVDQDAQLARQRAELAPAERRAAGLDFWRTGLGAKGLKSYLLDARLGEMAQEANRWVRLLTGGTTWVEFATQREVGKGRSKKLVEDFSIKVLRANPDATITSRAYRSWSGGEKYRIALGIDFGLARLVAKRAKRSYDLLILDEVFQHLDSTGKEAVAEMLQALAQEKSSIFCIDHDEQFQHLFPGKMIVRKHARASRVVDGVNLETEPTREAGGSPAGQQQGQVLAAHPAFFG
jgi:DNA repair exonuclease SbcCD ATPase subunit